MSERRGIDWRRVSRGVFWIGIGSILLLNTTGTLPWSIWMDALSYWPVLLVALGLRLIFDRSGLRPLVLLSPALVLGTLAFVAATGPSLVAATPVTMRAERLPGTERWTLSGNLAFARLDLQARALPDGVLVEGSASSSGTPSVRVTGGRDGGRVRLRGGSREWALGRRRLREQWTLGLARDLPLATDLDLAFTGGEIDLSDVELTRLDLDGAFNRLTVRLGRPAGDVRIYIDGAFNKIDLVVPSDTPVRAREHGFLASIAGRGSARTRSLQGPAYRLGLEGAFSRVTVRSE